MSWFTSITTTQRSPFASSTKPATACTPVSVPPLRCACPAKAPFLDLKVPSTAKSESDETSSGITGLAHAARRSAASDSAEMRSLRESPAPFSITRPGVAMPFAESHSRTMRSLAAASPGAPVFCAERVRKSCRAITLLEYLLMSRTSAASGSDSKRRKRVAPAGVVPGRTLPVKRPPVSLQIQRKAASA